MDFIDNSNIALRNEILKIAKYTIEAFLKNNELDNESFNAEIVSKLKKIQAGCFVTLHKNGDLRGCIGTISSAYGNLFEEIKNNAISAGFKDPRFNPLMIDELTELNYSVDVLMEAEDIESINELDVKKYGVIVTMGFRRGLLLPNLDGVDTPEYQVAIALNKAGISPSEDFSMQRFEVIRFEED